MLGRLGGRISVVVAQAAFVHRAPPTERPNDRPTSDLRLDQSFQHPPAPLEPRLHRAHRLGTPIPSTTGQPGRVVNVASQRGDAQTSRLPSAVTAVATTTAREPMVDTSMRIWGGAPDLLADERHRDHRPHRVVVLRRPFDRRSGKTSSIRARHEAAGLSTGKTHSRLRPKLGRRCPRRDRATPHNVRRPSRPSRPSPDRWTPGLARPA